MHAFPSYIALAALLLAGASVVRVSPGPATETAEPAVRRFTLDLRPLQDAWAWLRGRGGRTLRSELAATSYYLEQVRGFAAAVVEGAMSRAEAHAALMSARFPSVATRCACAEQLSACLHANVARVWVDDTWPVRLEAHRSTRSNV
jgi:hypothetical protein